jgi:hypothetical protein
MKKVLLLVVVAAVIGAGVYVAFFNQKLKTELTEQVSNLVTGSDFKSLSSYESDFEKAEIVFDHEKEGFVGGFSESLKMRFYKAADDSSILLACKESSVHVMKAEFKLSSIPMKSFLEEDFQRMFKKEADFSVDGQVDSELFEASWNKKDGLVTVVVSHKKLPKIKSMSALSKEQQDQLVKLKELITQKMSMETKWQELEDSKHQAIDPKRFQEITSRMAELKTQAVELSKTAKAIMKDLPMQQVIALKDKMEGGL